ncbi:hypothetical protein GQ55_1G414500 [Panicum hallii var. hallii]|uniref:Pectinesterase n=1 Tax=Panicum hallii var. hallii TaxID=1504633 RepID=A0A2T7FD02_9POAL|nr:hypothetical protein GQ55_1G414500 [Panicum hallii var. hallii]
METFGGARSPEWQAKRRLPIVAWSCAMATVLALATVAPVAAGKGDEAASGVGNAAAVSRIAATSASAPPSSVNVTLICRSTPDPRACETALTSAEARSARDPFAASVQFAMARATTARSLARNLSASAPAVRPSGMHDCAELLDISLAQLRDALRGCAADAAGATTWLSAALTNQGTCNDSLAAAATPVPAGRDAVRKQVAALAQFIRTSLALHVKKVKGGGGSGVPPSAAPSPNKGAAFPSWLPEHDRRLLQSPATNAMTPDAVVALDGSGTHRSINEAIAAVTAPVGTMASGGRGAGGSSRKVIHVKAGRYKESVSISYQQKDVMLVGDGKGKTIIDGDKSVAGGYTTYSSATFAAMGAGFIAKGLSIVNSAGPEKGQAVALLVGGDRSVVYQCEIKAHQDTLFTHSNRQFYAESDISGTVDFIFGNSAVVFQRSNIQARKPSPGQQDVVTAQGRDDPNQNTGISIHRCRITGASDLGNTPVYLGRPWKKYARVAVMESTMDGSVVPAGWLAWPDQPAPSTTLYYGEYRNTGAGAETKGRVTWTGVHTSMSTADATGFTVEKFIMGNSWLGATGVGYTSGL